MKKKISKKYLLVMGFIIILFFINACDKEPEQEPEKCECDPAIEKFLPCECGKDDCNCAVSARGYITDAEHPGLNVPIYQTPGVADADAITATGNIKAGYDGLAGGRRDALAGANNFNKIEIVVGEGYSFDPITGIVEIGADWNAEAAREIFVSFVIPHLTQAESLP